MNPFNIHDTPTLESIREKAKTVHGQNTYDYAEVALLLKERDEWKGLIAHKEAKYERSFLDNLSDDAICRTGEMEGCPFSSPKEARAFLMQITK